MRLLVIGGTRFVGRAFVERAVCHGHDVAVFHRSVSEPEDFPVVEHLHGDRDGGLGLLRGRSWDAVLDTCAYVPRVVREAAVALGDVAGHYTLISSLSVYPDDMPAGSAERAATRRPPFPRTEVVTDQTYGPLKVACEDEAGAAFGDRCLIIRPGYIVGPHDPSDRFTFYLRRAAGGGEIRFPGVHTYDAAKAVAAGLRCRPLAQTVHDTLAWDRGRGLPDLRTGLSAEMETELLATWHSRR